MPQAYRLLSNDLCNNAVRDKKVTTKEARLPTASGGTRCALTVLRSNSRRKNEGLPEVGARRLRAREPY